MGGSVHIVKKLPASKETGLELNADKTKYKVMSPDHYAGRSHNIKIQNSSVKRVEQFKYLGTTITNKHYTQEDIKGKLKSGNFCYH